MDELSEWLAEHSSANVKVVLADYPPAGTAWQAQEGWGWIFKPWFRTWREARQAREAMRTKGWDPKFWGRKLRVSVPDGYEGQRLADFVLARWPKARIQLRND